jgi:hypothetical protein
MEHDVVHPDTPPIPDAPLRSVLVITDTPLGWFIRSVGPDVHRELVAARAFMDQVVYPAVDSGPLLPIREPGEWYFTVDADGNFELGGRA